MTKGCIMGFFALVLVSTIYCIVLTDKCWIGYETGRGELVCFLHIELEISSQGTGVGKLTGLIQ